MLLLGVQMSGRPSQIRIGVAVTAMRALLRNPDDTAQVFRIIEALSGRHGERMLERVKATPSGKRLLMERPDLTARLTDRATLENLPEGTLGREYLRFLDSEGITAEGLVQASVDGSTRNVSGELEYLGDRMRDQHDLWHVLTGYNGDLVGEAALLAFSFAQTRNPGVGFIVAVALLRGREPQVRRLIARGFARGMRAAWLPAVEWEKLLPLPVADVRRQLGIGAPPEYQTVRSAEYFANKAA